MAKSSRVERSRAAERAAEIRRAQERNERRRRNLVVGSVVAAVIVVIAVVGISLQSGRDATGGPATAPTGADGYAIVHGSTSAPVTVTVYEDFMCPFCGQFERLTSSWVDSYADSGKVKVVVHPLAFLDRSSNGSRYSTRAANAYASVLQAAGPAVAAKFHDILFQHQPAEGTSGATNSQLVTYAVQAGASKSEVEPLIDGLHFEHWVANGTDAASKAKVTSTPTIEVDGKRLAAAASAQLAATLKATVDKAVAQRG